MYKVDYLDPQTGEIIPIFVPTYTGTYQMVGGKLVLVSPRVSSDTIQFSDKELILKQAISELNSEHWEQKVPERMKQCKENIYQANKGGKMPDIKE